MLCHVIEMAEVVEVDDGAEGDCLLKLLPWRIVRGEHDLLALDACRRRDEELCDAAAVRARAFLMQDLHDARIRQRLNREMLAEPRRPREGLPQAAEVRADLRLVVDVKRGRPALYQLQGLLLAERKFFFVHIVLPQSPPISCPIITTEKHLCQSGGACDWMTLPARAACPGISLVQAKRV